MGGSNQRIQIWHVLDEDDAIAGRVADWRGVDAPFMGERVTVQDPDVNGGNPRIFQVRWREWEVISSRLNVGDVEVVVSCMCALVDANPLTPVPEGVPTVEGGVSDAPS